MARTCQVSAMIRRIRYVAVISSGSSPRISSATGFRHCHTVTTIMPTKTIVPAENMSWTTRQSTPSS